MASKGPKTGGTKPAAPKAAASPKAPTATKPKVAAPTAEKPAPVVEAEIVTPPVTETPAAVPEAVPQEVETVIEAAAEPVVAITEVAEAAAEPVVEAVQETIAAAPEAPAKKEVIMDTITKAQAAFTDFNDRAKAAVEKSTKIAEEFNDFAKGNVEAFVESGKITAKGFETLGQEAADYGRKSFESATAALKSLSSVKSPTEFFKLQSDFFRSSFDSAVAEASKTTEALIKLSSDAAQPISNRFAVAVEKAKIAA